MGWIAFAIVVFGICVGEGLTNIGKGLSNIGEFIAKKKKEDKQWARTTEAVRDREPDGRLTIRSRRESR